mmetsp:Transcript_90785/g.280762  ORF Transcript_90785/g.280762 Transcript_90785/m.280762 type:complete len:200 (+) Transcript_90785:248-847(+)
MVPPERHRARATPRSAPSGCAARLSAGRPSAASAGTPAALASGMTRPGHLDLDRRPRPRCAGGRSAAGPRRSRRRGLHSGGTGTALVFGTILLLGPTLDHCRKPANLRRGPAEGLPWGRRSRRPPVQQQARASCRPSAAAAAPMQRLPCLRLRPSRFLSQRQKRSCRVAMLGLGRSRAPPRPRARRSARMRRNLCLRRP